MQDRNHSEFDVRFRHETEKKEGNWKLLLLPYLLLINRRKIGQLYADTVFVPTRDATSIAATAAIATIARLLLFIVIELSLLGALIRIRLHYS